MAKVFDRIEPELARWIEAQPLFFVGTAPLAADGHVNVSPKGGSGLFRVVGERAFSWVDLYGSGAETAAHLRENGRVTVMLASFDGRPKVVRLHGTGRVTVPADPTWTQALAPFPLDDAQRATVRSVVDVAVERVSTSCGFAVPTMRYDADRDLLYRSAATRIEHEGPDAIRRYVDERNATSIDGLPAFERGALSPAGVDA